MVFSLSAKAEADFYRLESYEVVDSTNNLAVKFAESHDSGRLWITAEEQTGGRGRRGHFWQSPKGNLYATLLLMEGLTAEQTATLGFVAGLALYEALSAVLPQSVQAKHDIKLKWPNDMLADRAKFAGILPEFVHLSSKAEQKSGFYKNMNKSFVAEGSKTASLVGIGVNVAAAPKFVSSVSGQAFDQEQNNNALPYPTTDLRSLGADCSPQDLFQALSAFWAENYILWNKGHGMAAIREKWLQHAAYKGEAMYLMQEGQKIKGIFETIDEAGRLVLCQDNGKKLLISAGDVYFGDIASARTHGSV